MAIQIRVLHVDDDQLFLETSKELLLELAKDVSIDTASNVDEALKKINTQKYDAIVSDYDMPVKNGLDFIKHLKENNITTPFILFTGKGREDVAIEALNLGVDHYLNKQGDPETVYKELAACIHALNEKTKATKFLIEHKGLPIESMPAAIAIIDFNGIVIDGNTNLERISGFKKEDLIGKSVFSLDFTSQEAFVQMGQSLSEVFAGRKAAQPVEYSFKRKDGSLVSVEFYAFPVRRDEETAILCEINDVSERKKVEEHLKSTLKRLQLAHEAAKSGTWEWNLETGENIWSEETRQLYGLTSGSVEASYELWLETIHSDDRERVAEAVNEAAKNRTELYVEYRLSDTHGKGRWLMSRGQPQKNEQGIIDRYLGVIIDITERKKTEEILKAIYKAIPIPTYTWQAVEDDFILSNYNDAAEKITNGLITNYIGIKASKLYGQTGSIFQDIKQCFESKTTFSKEMTYDFKSTLQQLCLDVKYIFVQPNLIIVHTEDITERKKAENALRESEEKYRMIAENMHDVITVTDTNGFYSYVSPSAEQLFGYKPNEMMGKNAFDLIHPEDMRNIVLPNIPLLINGGSLGPVEFRFKIKDESYIWLEGRVSSGSEAKGNLKLIVVSRDLRARKKAEEAAKESHRKLEIVNQKLHVVGNLTRHDIANKLSAAKANTYLLKKKLTDQPELIKYIDAIDETVNQSSKIFEFSKMYEQIGAEEPTLVNVAEQFKLAADLLPHSSVEIINNNEELIVLADNMLQQLFYNLIDNSIKHGKTVTVIQLNYEQDTTHTKLIYQDNGAGIPLDNKDKIFSQGFTTGGSGVGLKLVKRMIEVYGWTINEEGEPGKGAKFVITIPRNN